MLFCLFIKRFIINNGMLLKFFIFTGSEILGCGRLKKFLTELIAGSSYIIDKIEGIVIINGHLKLYKNYLLLLRILYKTARCYNSLGLIILGIIYPSYLYRYIKIAIYKFISLYFLL